MCTNLHFEGAVKICGVELKTGAKPLVLKTEKGNSVMGLVGADRKIDIKKISAR